MSTLHVIKGRWCFSHNMTKCVIKKMKIGVNLFGKKNS